MIRNVYDATPHKVEHHVRANLATSDVFILSIHWGEVIEELAWDPWVIEEMCSWWHGLSRFRCYAD
jgi:hypothetical protein